VKKYKFILSGGGTGGHVFPALAISKKLKEAYPRSNILFVGSLGRMEMKKVPKEGFKIIGLPIDGISRSLKLKNILFPFKAAISFLIALIIVIVYRPKIVVGTGGYASGPILFAAQLLNYPTVIQEQNSFAGLTNKILGRLAKKILVAYPNMERFFKKEKIVITGNPIRKYLLNKNISKNEAKSFFNLDPKKSVISILGGSLGAFKINKLIANNLDLFDKLGIQVLWQCGKIHYDEFKILESKNIKLFSFIERMDYWYKASDAIISRSGAITISEICLAQIPSILIPSPNVTENHQFHNAMALYNNKAAIVLEEKNIENNFAKVLNDFWNNQRLRNKMKLNLKLMSKPNASNEIIKIINTLI
tara:strand:- start:4935 stop:6020 length:1086 start_codon:yes stop_codon:yes gene_type:complete